MNAETAMSMAHFQHMSSHFFMGFEGIEELEHMRIGRDRMDIPYQLMCQTLEERGVVIGVATGLAGSGKGSLFRNCRSLALQDEDLKERLQARGKRLKFVAVQHATHVLASKTEKVRERYPQWAIDPNMPPGTYPPEVYRRAAELMYHDIQEEVLGKWNPKTEALFLVIESSSPTSYPKAGSVEKPVEVEGVTDRSNSPGYTLALDPQFRDAVYFFCMYREKNILQRAEAWRSNVLKEEKSFREIFGQDIKVVFTKEDGTRVNAWFLSEQLQREIALWSPNLQLPPQARLRADREFRMMMSMLKAQGLVKDGSQMEFFRYLKEALNLPRERFFVVRKEFYSGDKTFDLDYFLKSLAAELYPKIIRPSLLSYIRSRGQSGGVSWDNPGQSFSLGSPYTHQQL